MVESCVWNDLQWLSFWNGRNGSEKATFEQDFLIQQEMQIVPIEVKAETNVHSQSLKAFCEKFNPPLALRFSLLPYKNQGWMENIPLYGGCFL